MFDFAASFIGIYLLAPLLSWLFRKLRLDIPRSSWLFFVLPISIVSHLLVGTMTPMTVNFLNPDGHYLLKIVIVGSFLLGVKGVRVVRK